MGIVAQSVFTKAYAAAGVTTKGGSQYDPTYSHKGIKQEIAGALGLRGAPPAWLLAADEKSALECFDAIRSYVIANGYIGGKMLRPWVIDPDITGKLDRKEAWWGWEFETGYKGTKERGTAVAHCWDNYEGVIFDSEGEGNAAVEITFTPQEQSKFASGEAQALRFMNWLSENRELTMKTGNTNIGTHLNISHPLMTANNLASICQSMNRTVGALEQTIDGVGAVRQALFGRAHLYGGFYSQNQKSGVWLEGKLFRTTYNAKEFARYIKTADGISKCIDTLLKVFGDKEWAWQFSLGNYPYIGNLYEIVTDGAEPMLRWAGKGSGGGSHNGGGWELSQTLKTDKTPQTREDAAAEIKRKEEEERQRKIKEEEARLAALKEAEEEKKRRAMHAKGEKPKSVPKDHTWCEDCGDWHEE